MRISGIATGRMCYGLIIQQQILEYFARSRRPARNVICIMAPFFGHASE
jgi:hypothetical protein